jgi:pSer/pThr/pTyr-binding forkhead associated (FHA) protein
MSRCSRCGKLNEPEAVFCQDCGTQLAVDPNATESIELAKCSVCGKANPKDTRFCHVCGVRLQEEAAKPDRPAKPQIECPVCGRQTPAGFAFCQFCGNRMEGGAAKLAEAVPPTPPAGVRVSTGGDETAASKVSGVVSGETGETERKQEQKKERERDPGPRPDQTAELTGLSLTVKKMAAGETPAPAVSRTPDDGPPELFLVSIKKDHTEGARHGIDSFPCDLGRTEGQLTFANDRYLSDRHCRIVRTGGGFEVLDLDSVNGVYFRITGPEPISDGQSFLLGAQVLMFEQLLPEERQLNGAMENGVALFGSPVGQPWARLKQVTDAAVARDVYHVRQERIVLGRGSGEVTFGHDPLMSDFHAALSRDEGGAVLEDLGSSNGTFIRIRSKRKLAPGDTLRLGEQLLRFEPVGA